MKIYIFGAGASLGSQTPVLQDVLKAPLVDDLFNEKYKHYASSVGLPEARLADFQKEVISHGSLEKWLTQKWENLKNIKSSQKRVSEEKLFGKITFYIWWLLQNVSEKTYDYNNLYRVFIQKLNDKDEDYGLVNFNYDTLLDRAYQSEGVTLEGSLSNYVANRYIKPHGSVNWFLLKRDDDPVVDTTEQHQDINSRLDRATSLMFRSMPLKLDGIVIADPFRRDINNLTFIANAKFNSQYFYPMILMPLSSKLYTHFEGFNDKIISEGKNLLSQASEVYLIGYRAADEVIKEMFKSLPANTVINVINPDEGTKIMNEVLSWREDFIKGKVINQRFEDFVKDF